MAWTLRALKGLSFGLACTFVAFGCDDGGGDDTSASGGSNTTGGTPAEGTPIPFTDGWAPIDQNTFGIQGSFYTFNDNEDTDGDGIGGTSVIMPPDFAGTGTQVCATGTAGQVLPGADGAAAYDDYWGTAIGFNLSQEEGVDAALPYDAMSKGVAGFSFTIAGDNPIPATGELRFNIKVAGDDNNYCAEITASGNSTFMLTELYQKCWEMDTLLPTPNPIQLEALHWQYVTNTMASYDFSLCVTELRVIPAM